jgi:hypothetical protein
MKCSLTSSLGCAESLRGSGCSDVTGFQGFWTAGMATAAEAAATPCSNVRSQAAGRDEQVEAADAAAVEGSVCSSTCSLTAAIAVQQQHQHGSCAAAAAGDTSPSAAADGAAEKQQDWDQLLLLLSLDESVSLVQAAAPGSCDLDSSRGCSPVEQQQTQPQQQQQWLSGDELAIGCHNGCEDQHQEQPEDEQHAGDTVQQYDALAAELDSSTAPSSPGSPLPTPAGASGLPAAALLHSSSRNCRSAGWQQQGSSRYAECWPSPGSPEAFGSPGVLLSSPVLGAAAAARAGAAFEAEGCGAAAAAAAAIEEEAQLNLANQPAAHSDRSDVASCSHDASWDGDAVTPQQLQQWQHHVQGEQGEYQLALQVVDTAEADAALFSTPDTTSTHSRACYISNASEYAGSAAAAGSASGSSPSQQQLQLVQPNCIEFSPIRGVALWGEEAAAAAAAGMGTPGGCDSDNTAQQTPVVAGAATPGEAYAASTAAGDEHEQECCGPEFTLPLQQQCAATPCRVAPGAGCSVSGAGSPQFGWQRWQQQMQATSAAGGSSSRTPGSSMQQQQQQQPAESSSLLEQLLDESAESLQGLMQQESSSIAANAGASLSAISSSSTPQARQQQQAQDAGRQGYAPTVASLSWLQALQPQPQPGSTSSPAGSSRATPPSPAESVDSFVCAAAGEPYSSACFASGGKNCSSNNGSSSKLAHHRRSQSWSAFEGLGSMLDSTGAAATPATVACKDGWGPAAAAAATAGGSTDGTSCRLFETPAGAPAARNGQAAASAAAGCISGTPAPANTCSDGQDDHADPQNGCGGEDCAQSEAEGDSPGKFVLFRAGGGGSMADLGLLNPVAVQDLADRLAAAELRATQQQQEVVKVGVGLS